MLTGAVLILVITGGLLDGMRGPGALLQGSKGGPSATLRSMTDSDRYGVYVAIRHEAPGASVIVDPLAAPAFRETYLRALGMVEDIRIESVPLAVFAVDSPVRAGAFRGGPDWVLHIASDSSSPRTLLVGRSGTEIWIVDARLVEGTAAGDGGLRGQSSPVSSSILVRAAVDSTMLVLLMLAGGLLLRGGPLSAVRPALALLIGVALQGSMGLLRLSGVWSHVGALALAVLLGVLLRRSHRVGWGRADGLPLAVSAVVITVVSAWTRWRGLLWLSPDSVAYLAGAQVLADRGLLPDLVEFKRGLALQALHAPGFALGVEGMWSLGPVLLVAGAVLIAMVPLLLRSANSSSWVVSGLAATAILMSNWMQEMAIYGNSHLVVAVLLLGLAIVLGLGHTEEGPAESSAWMRMLPALPIIVALVLLRPEGTLLVGLMLLGALRAARAIGRAPWYALGTATAVWNSTLALGAAQRAEPVAEIVLVMLGLSVVIVAVPSLIVRMRRQDQRRFVLVVGTALWALTILLLIGDFGRISFIEAAVANIGQGRGLWGSFAPAVMLLGLLAVGLRTGPRDGPGLHAARWLLIGFVPLTFMAKLGDGLDRVDAELGVLLVGGGRVGWGDSVNRMWTHAVLLAFLLVVARVALGSSSRTDPQLRPTGLLHARSAVIAVAAVTIAGAWSPFYVTSVGASPEVWTPALTVEVLGETVLPPLLAGTVVEQKLVFPVSPVVPVGAADPTLCVDLQFVTFARRATGQVRITLSAAGSQQTSIIEASSIEDWGLERVCLGLPSDGVVDGTVLVSVEGIGADPEAAVALVGASGSPVLGDVLAPAAVVRSPSAGSVTGLPGPLVMAVSVVHGASDAPVWRTLADVVTLAIPAVIAMLVVIALMAQVVQRGGGIGSSSPRLLREARHRDRSDEG